MSLNFTIMISIKIASNSHRRSQPSQEARIPSTKTWSRILELPSTMTMFMCETSISCLGHASSTITCSFQKRGKRLSSSFPKRMVLRQSMPECSLGGGIGTIFLSSKSTRTEWITLRLLPRGYRERDSSSVMKMQSSIMISSEFMSYWRPCNLLKSSILKRSSRKSLDTCLKPPWITTEGTI